MYIAAILTHLV